MSFKYKLSVWSPLVEIVVETVFQPLFDARRLLDRRCRRGVHNLVGRLVRLYWLSPHRDSTRI
jgi:hypothetical protein